MDLKKIKNKMELDRSEIVWNVIDENRSWVIIDGTYRVKYTIPIYNTDKKWWQFWKKSRLTANDANKKLSELMDRYKSDENTDMFIPIK